ncbi:MAG: nucleotidyltransferase family protein [Deltaproteobacteria bacterium]|nr:nucleotidyltransferase family protein [Deltaproteobacteria bacterium]
MKCIILAAGYGTRLYPLTENFPKPLLEVNGKTILDWLLKDIDSTGNITEYAVVSNHRYAAHFFRWAKGLNINATVRILDDGSVSNDTRLGAVKDIQFAINALKYDDDLLVIAGDNLLDFSLGGLMSYFNKKQATCAMRYYEKDPARLIKSGVVQVDSDECIVHMEEKPETPLSNWCTPPFYVYHKKDVSLIKEAIEEDCDTDAPGNFLAWLCKHTKVYAMEMPGRRYDIGNLENYKKAQEQYKGIKIYE